MVLLELEASRRRSARVQPLVLHLQVEERVFLLRDAHVLLDYAAQLLALLVVNKLVLQLQPVELHRRAPHRFVRRVQQRSRDPRNQVVVQRSRGVLTLLLLLALCEVRRCDQRSRVLVSASVSDFRRACTFVFSFLCRVYAGVPRPFFVVFCFVGGASWLFGELLAE